MCRLVLTILLLFATALSGAAEAGLRAVGPQSHAVICAEGKAVAITLGADGLPADPDGDRGHCPDCLPLPVSATGTSAASGPARPTGRLILSLWPAASLCGGPALALLPESRGPPTGDKS